MKRKKLIKHKLLSVAQTIVFCKKRLPYARFSEATLYRHIAGKSFPPPVKIVGRNYWSVKDIDRWITKLVDGK